MIRGVDPHKVIYKNNSFSSLISLFYVRFNPPYPNIPINSTHSLDVAENYSKKYILNECIKKCDQAHDSQFHLYMCPRLQQQNIISDNNIIEYEQIYSSNVKNQLHIMKMIYAAYEQRCKIMSSSENVEDPAGYQPFTGVGNQGVKTGQN